MDTSEALKAVEAIKETLATRTPEEVLFNYSPNGQANGKTKPIARAMSVMGQPNSEEALKMRPKSMLDEAQKFWETVARAQKAYLSNKDPDDKLHLRAKLLTARRFKESNRVDFGYSVVTRASDLFKLMKTKQKLQEQFPAFYDPFTSSGTSPTGFTIGGADMFNSEYVPILGGPWAKQLYIQGQLEANAKAFEAWNHSPIAHAALMIKHNFVFGRGVKIQFQNDQVQDWWEKWEVLTEFQPKINKAVLDASIAGELMFEYFDAPAPICQTWLSVDPSSVWEIIHDPENIEDVKAYWQNYPTPFLMQTLPGVPITKYIIRMIPPQKIDWLRLNCTSYERRGRPDIYAALTFLKWARDYVWSKTVRAKIMNTYILDILAKGNSGDISAALAALPNPLDVATVFAHNEAIELKITNPALANEGRYQVLETMIALIGVSIGVPPEFLGSEGGGRSRATAVIASEPATKHFQDRQEQLGWMIKKLVKRVLMAAMAKGELPSLLKMDDLEARVIWASIAKEDRTPLLQDLKTAEEQRWISKRRAAETAAEEFDVDQYDFDQEQKTIDDDKEKGYVGELFNDQNPQGAPGPDTVGQEPGPELPGSPDQPNPAAHGGNGKSAVSGGPNKSKKDAQNNPMSSQIGTLKKQLKQSDRGQKSLRVSLNESQIAALTGIAMLDE